MSKRIIICMLMLTGIWVYVCARTEQKPKKVMKPQSPKPLIKQETSSVKLTQAPGKGQQPKQMEVKDKTLNYHEMILIDTQRAMLESKQGRDAQKVVEAKQREYATWAQTEQQKLVQIKNEIDTQASMLTPDARRKKEEEFSRLQREAQNRDQEWKYEIQSVMQQETDKMLKDIEEAAKTIAQSTGKAAVIDAPSGRVLYLRDDKNSTQNFIEVLDKQYIIKLAQREKDQKDALSAAGSETQAAIAA